MEDTMTDIFSVQSESTPIENTLQSNDSNIDFLPIEQFVTKETKDIKTRKKDKILIIQVTLLIIWVILTVLVYFFGYDLFEPFIKV